MSFRVDLTDLNVEYQGSTIATRRTFIQKYPSVTARFLHAIIRGVHFFKTRKEDTVRTLAKFVGTNDVGGTLARVDYSDSGLPS